MPSGSRAGNAMITTRRNQNFGLLRIATAYLSQDLIHQPSSAPLATEEQSEAALCCLSTWGKHNPALQTHRIFHRSPALQINRARLRRQFRRVRRLVNHSRLRLLTFRLHTMLHLFDKQQAGRRTEAQSQISKGPPNAPLVRFAMTGSLRHGCAA